MISNWYTGTWFPGSSRTNTRVSNQVIAERHEVSIDSYAPREWRIASTFSAAARITLNVFRSVTPSVHIYLVN